MPSINNGKQLSFSVRLRGAPAHIICEKATSWRNSSYYEPLADHPNPCAHAHQIVLRHLVNAFDDFVLIHAGVVAKNRAAAILSGPPAVGKTTLVLRLLQEGFTFFSDDVCPVHRQTGQASPFPRSVWLAPSSSKPQKWIRQNRKVPIRPDKLEAPVGIAACQAKCVLYLDPGKVCDSFHELEIGVKLEWEADVIQGLEKLVGVSLQKRKTPLCEWRVKYPKGEGLTRNVKEYLNTQRQRIWNAYKIDRIQPNFERSPVLTPMPTHQAVFHQLGDLKQGPPHILPGRFFMELSTLFNNVPCYRLTTGKLEKMIALTRGLWQELSTETNYFSR
ncbi:MAG: hypothetical protein QNJ97_15070 [Myxococcota bacterium]|nr:hypothetical protein [Myxococcota bacterium]